MKVQIESIIDILNKDIDKLKEKIDAKEVARSVLKDMLRREIPEEKSGREEEEEWKVGDRLRIIEKTIYHEFHVGEIVRITEICKKYSRPYLCDSSSGSGYWILKEDAVKF